MADNAPGSSASGPLRRPRVLAMALVVLLVEWSLAPPAEIVRDPERAPLPFAILAILVPISLAVWASSVVREGRPSSLRIDILRAVLTGSLVYVLAAIGYRLAGG